MIQSDYYYQYIYYVIGINTTGSVISIMDRAIEEGFKKFSELVDNAGLFIDEDGAYFLIGVGVPNCKNNSKIVEQVLNEIYKYTDEINVTILIVPENVYPEVTAKLKRIM